MSTGEAQTETYQFQAEVNQLLKLVIHSLYSNRDIFLRELISNASDACDKLRFEALTDESISEHSSDLNVTVDYDADAGTVTVSDNGIGMTRDDVISNIGTIAKSGTQQFLEQMTGDQKKDAQLIGQFGVGFYSAFVVADRVDLVTRHAREGADAAVRWSSDGSGTFTLESTTRDEPGTDVILHLNEDCAEFADQWRLRSIIRKYSDHISFPIRMPKQDEEGNRTDEFETVNSASALWKRARKDISEEEYKEFYKHVAHDFEDPLAWTHSQTEGKYEYTTLFYLPKRAPFDLFDRERAKQGIKLYVQRVFIMDDAEHLMPNYLRFVRGLVDSNDLPLNVSREILQSNRVIDHIRSASVKKILDLLEDKAQNDPELYAQFWGEFGQVLKEGPVEDFANRDRLLGLLRFASTHEDTPEQKVSLDQYIERMAEGQEKIWYVTADSFAAAQKSPHLEVFRKKGIEVLLLHDRVDEWLMSQVAEYNGTKFASVAKGELDFEPESEEETDTEGADDLAGRIGKALGDQVGEVRVSRRLTSSPACLVLGEGDLALHMQHLLRQAGHHVPDSQPTLEINPGHPLLKRMAGLEDGDRFGEWSRVLFDQAVLAEGGQLGDPAAFVNRLNDLLVAWPEPSAEPDAESSGHETSDEEGDERTGTA
ncbi:MAG: molecular chaperone HtpG [Halofilum sp. (in: g-proteobacteria)]|nr:molecular chaperone HtpG [Halofilum sp. (in: g-proteobacteria)]